MVFQFKKGLSCIFVASLLLPKPCHPGLRLEEGTILLGSRQNREIEKIYGCKTDFFMCIEEMPVLITKKRDSVINAVLFALWQEILTQGGVDITLPLRAAGINLVYRTVIDKLSRDRMRHPVLRTLDQSFFDRLTKALGLQLKQGHVCPDLLIFYLFCAGQCQFMKEICDKNPDLARFFSRTSSAKHFGLGLGESNGNLPTVLCAKPEDLDLEKQDISRLIKYFHKTFTIDELCAKELNLSIIFSSQSARGPHSFVANIRSLNLIKGERQRPGKSSLFVVIYHQKLKEYESSHDLEVENEFIEFLIKLLKCIKFSVTNPAVTPLESNQERTTSLMHRPFDTQAIILDEITPLLVQDAEKEESSFFLRSGESIPSSPQGRARILPSS